MNLTPEILFYLFSKEHPLLEDAGSAPGRSISSIRHFHRKNPLLPDAIYVMPETEYRKLSSSKKDQLRAVFLTAEKPLREYQSVPSHPAGTALAVTDAFETPEELTELLSALHSQLLREENELLLAVLSPDRNDDVFSFGAVWFPWEYSIVDLDMRLIYRSENLHKVLGGERVDRIPQESIQELILSKEFHEAAKKKKPFYQSMTFNNLTAFARNILLENQYAGRVVMFLDENRKQAPAGAEELFEFYTDCITEALRRSGRLSIRPHNDPLRTLCTSLLNREQLREQSIREVLSRAGWQISDTYCVINFLFLPDSVWEMQKETTLPYLADALEDEWPSSCAVNTGLEIHLVLNLSLSGKGTDLSAFHQQFAYFVRDHICIAGVSSVFRDFSLLADAKTCADAALRLGQKESPHRWYYLFDDYRLEFIKETLKQAAAPAFLCHPAVRLLKEYDQKNHTELSRTLQAYLENNHNMTTAADAIFIHRTTFFRRMDHISQLTKLQLADPDTLIQLELSYQLEDKKL